MYWFGPTGTIDSGCSIFNKKYSRPARETFEIYICCDIIDTVATFRKFNEAGGNFLYFQCFWYFLPVPKQKKCQISYRNIYSNFRLIILYLPGHSEVLAGAVAGLKQYVNLDTVMTTRKLFENLMYVHKN
jgi:hypothetical protein